MNKDLEEFYQKKIIKYQKLIFTLSKHCEEIDDKILKIKELLNDKDLSQITIADIRYIKKLINL